MPGGSIGADVGCGNGKYLNVNPNIFTVGSDRCEGLIEICAKKGCEAMVCDACELPYKSSSFVCWRVC